jgi:hypothetical protein
MDVKINNSPPYIRFFIIFAFFALITYFIVQFAQISEISKNWPKYRCRPQIMPFASLYGYNTQENFSYCLTNIFKDQSSTTLGPLFSILANFGGVLGSLLGSINNLRLQGASLFGGITKIFSEFTTRISMVSLKIQTSAIRIKSLMNRVQTTMFAIMYMGLSAVNAATSFGDTALFRFLDTFCFPPETLIEVINVDTKSIDTIKIKDIYIGQKLKNGKQITSTFKFHVVDQPMVQIGDIKVSSNHYVLDKMLGSFVKAINHPDAILSDPWTGELICLNCQGNTFDIGIYTFLDYDETPEGDHDTMNWIEQHLNGSNNEFGPRHNYDYTTVVKSNTRVVKKDGSDLPINEVNLNDILSMGKVIGIVKKVVYETCTTSLGTELTPATLIWDIDFKKWTRAGELYPIKKLLAPQIFMNLIIEKHATLQISTGEFIRDYVEIHSPDSEQFYSKIIEKG